MNRHQVIVIPGLSDEVKKLTWAVGHWKRFGLDPTVYQMGWQNGEDFDPKLERLVKVIDKFSKKGSKVSLVGCSAGGSAVLNAFLEREESVYRVINVCGRLRRGNQRGFRSFVSRTASSRSFAHSIDRLESREPELSPEDRKRVMTIRPLFGDELVPSDTTIVSGALNLTVPTPEHAFSIAMALTVFHHPIIKFLTEER